MGLHADTTAHFLVVVCGAAGCSGEHLLGYERGTMYGKSWYEMIHPDDIDEARFKHMDRQYIS